MNNGTGAATENARNAKAGGQLTHRVAPEHVEVWNRLVSVRSQQYSALVETERAMAMINPSFTRKFLSRDERRAIRRD